MSVVMETARMVLASLALPRMLASYQREYERLHVAGAVSRSPQGSSSTAAPPLGANQAHSYVSCGS